MTKAELLKKLVDIPDNAKIFVLADHGQVDYVAIDVSTTTFDVSDIRYSSEDIDWEENDPSKPITGILLS